MAIFKCKICGGTLEINVGETVATCEYCGTKQTLPKLDDEKKANLFDRANHFRRNNDFDKAMGIYEQILNEDTEDAESYWSILLCRYGIEYVEDPSSHKRVPTVNRAQFTSVFDDEDYKSAIKYADGSQRNIYEAEAAAINEIQKGILAISRKEEPFDVFICYKETDNNGRRTQDSVLATELYHELTKEGFKVFFSRITLEDKLGIAYEPYIFAALHSAKVMVALGTKAEHFNAVWVKNEWSRYLSLIKNGANKILIPAYRDMDPYDLPEEFSHLQAQDMAKLGFIQDLVRGIKKLVPADGGSGIKEPVIAQTATMGNVSALVKRGFLALEDGEWAKADEFFEQALNQNAEDAQAYVGKLMAELQVHRQENLSDCSDPFDNSGNYQKAIRFADNKLKTELEEYITVINERNEKNRLEQLYTRAVNLMSINSRSSYGEAAGVFKTIPGYKDSNSLCEECLNKAEDLRKESILKNANSLLDESHQWTGKEYDRTSYAEAISQLETIRGYKDAGSKIEACRRKIEEIEFRIEQEKAEEQRQAEQKRILAERRAKRIKKTVIASSSVIVACLLLSFVAKIYKVNKMANLRDNYVKYENLVSAGSSHTVGLKSDGTVVAVGANKDGQCDVSDWEDIVAISAAGDRTVGLKSDGTVVAAGENLFGECDVSDWKDIVAISAGEGCTAGLKSDGTVIVTGYNKSHFQREVSDWEDITAISASSLHLVGLKSDGKVLAVGKTNDASQCEVSGWRNIVAVSAGGYHTVGLKSDGTVIVAGWNSAGQCEVSDWKDIVAIYAGDYHTIGLKSDGTVVAVGSNEYGECEVSDWKDIVAIYAGLHSTVGLKSDGTVVALGYADADSWDLLE